MYKACKELTNTEGTSVSSSVSTSSISAATSQSMFSLFATTLGSIPVSVVFAYRDFFGFFFFISTYPFEQKKYQQLIWRYTLYQWKIMEVSINNQFGTMWQNLKFYMEIE